jgi:hypothetical protein
MTWPTSLWRLVANHGVQGAGWSAASLHFDPGHIDITWRV